MNEFYFSEIPRSVLAALIDFAGKPGTLSPRPLMGEACALNKSQLAELYAGNYIDLPEGKTIQFTPSFAQVARVLLDPKTQATLRLWGDEDVRAETSLLFPETILEGGGILLNQIDSLYSISGFADTTDVFELVHSVLPPVQDGQPGFSFEAHLDVTTAAVLFGAIDLARNQPKTKTTKKTKTQAFTGSELYGYLDGQWGLTGFEHLITFLAAAGLQPKPPSLIEVEHGLQLLLGAEFLVKKGEDKFSLSSNLEPLVSLMPGLIPGIQWQRVSYAGSGDIPASDHIYLFGDRSLILFLSPSKKGKVFISQIEKEQIIDFFVQELIPEQAPKVSIDRSCTKCGITLVPNKRFCTQCGTPVGETPRPHTTTQKRKRTSKIKEKSAPTKSAVSADCPQCGHKLKSGKKFCTHCGYRLS